MSFRELLITDKQPNDEAVVKHLQQTQLPVVLYGASPDVADGIVKKLSLSHIHVAMVAYDDLTPPPAALQETKLLKNIPAAPTTAVSAQFEAFNVVIGFVKGYPLAAEIAHKFKNAQAAFYLSEVFDMEIITPQFVNENIDSLEVLYGSLSDERSKQSFAAYLQSKISQDMKFLPPVFEKVQYFPQDIISLTTNELYFDGGAFTGDTIADFCKYSSGKYRHIWAAEPDRQNFDRLSRYVQQVGFDNVTLCNKGIYSNTGRQPFCSEGSMLSMITDNSGQSIEVDTIDNITAGEAVTFIKLDVEGAELEALKGAEQTIRRHQPILAVSIYHRQRDFIDIPLFIKSIAPDYHLFFRAHKKLAIDAVLYFLPQNRLKILQLS